MTQTLTDRPASTIIYPESDGKPMSDNTRQFRWITVLQGNIAALFRDRDDVFVCGNQNWYPIEKDPRTVQAPDVYVVFGRPKGDRSSYKQWEENDVPMTVVFEVLSPGNTWHEMADKLAFYDDHGVEEYYIYDPDHNTLSIYTRGQAVLRFIREADGFVSPRLGIRFQMTDPEMTVFRPDGAPFLSFEDLDAEYHREKVRADKEQQRADKAEQDRDKEQQRADKAEQDREEERHRADKAEQQLVALARLAELSRKARLGQATATELQELEQLEQQTGV